MNIVVDTNVLSYFWLPGSRTAAAAELRRATDEWLAPRIWRSEFRNVLAGYIRARSLDLAQAKAIMRACEADLANPGFSDRLLRCTPKEKGDTEMAEETSIFV